MKIQPILAGALLALATGGAAQAATLTATAVPGNVYQHSANSPCIISGQNCPQQPGTFAYTKYNNTGNMPANFTQDSPGYTVAQLLGFGDFQIGVDVNQTNQPQTLSLFQMWVNGVAVDTYTGSAGNVPATNNGNGYADYLISGFTSLANFSQDALVVFRMTMNDMNDGPESFFIVPGTPAPVPLPAAGIMLLAGLGTLAAVRRRKTA